MATEDNFPTLADLTERLRALVEDGLGSLPVQALVVPDSTLQAIARHTRPKGLAGDPRPALMIEFDSVEGRLGASIITTDRMRGRPANPVSH